tara:strand:+ start:967 stop:1452 length:486 start_codon:yes stop_codon:yes gene_type:complete
MANIDYNVINENKKLKEYIFQLRDKHSNEMLRVKKYIDKQNNKIEYMIHKLSQNENILKEKNLELLYYKNQLSELQKNFEKYQEYLDSFQQQISIKDDELYRLTEQFNLINTKNNRNRKKTEKDTFNKIKNKSEGKKKQNKIDFSVNDKSGINGDIMINFD